MPKTGCLKSIEIYENVLNSYFKLLEKSSKTANHHHEFEKLFDIEKFACLVLGAPPNTTHMVIRCGKTMGEDGGERGGGNDQRMRNDQKVEKQTKTRELKLEKKLA